MSTPTTPPHFPVFASSPTSQHFQMSSPTRVGSDDDIPQSPLTDIFYKRTETPPPLFLNPELDPPMGLEDVFIIDTDYDSSLPANCVAPFSNRFTDAERFSVTENLRKVAMKNAVTPRNLDDLKAKVSTYSKCVRCKAHEKCLASISTSRRYTDLP